MKISRAKPSDLDAVLSMVRACTRHMESLGILQWDDIYPNRAVLEQDIAKKSLFVMADGAIIAAIVLNDYQEPEYGDVPWAYPGERILVVHRLCVHPDSQGQGVASRLMDFAEELGQTDGCAAIRLDAFTQNPTAVSLYEKRGYRKAGIVKFRKGPFFCFEKRIEQLKDCGR